MKLGNTFLLSLLFLMHFGYAMGGDFLCWEDIRKKALLDARGELSKVRINIDQLFADTNNIKNVDDMAVVIRNQARLGRWMIRNVLHTKKHEAEFKRILKKARGHITTHNVRYCLERLERFFTGNTILFKEFAQRKTILSAQGLLRNNVCCALDLLHANYDAGSKKNSYVERQMYQLFR